jgi:dihydrofolate reductase
MITAIVAIAENLAIGRDGKLPWHYPVDLRFFKQKTTGKVVVMGRRTWESIGRPLPNRLNVVLSRSLDSIDHDHCLVLREKSQVLTIANYLKDDLFIIGGASVYQLFAESVDRWIVTRIPETVTDADAFMPGNFLDGFTNVASEEIGDGLVVSVYDRAAGV